MSSFLELSWPISCCPLLCLAVSCSLWSPSSQRSCLPFNPVVFCCLLPPSPSVVSRCPLLSHVVICSTYLLSFPAVYSRVHSSPLPPHQLSELYLPLAAVVSCSLLSPAARCCVLSPPQFSCCIPSHPILVITVIYAVLCRRNISDIVCHIEVGTIVQYAAPFMATACIQRKCECLFLTVTFVYLYRLSR